MSELRSALVTGGSAGIGLAIVHALAADGWAVTAVARDRDRLAAAVAGIEGVHAHAADAADVAAIEAAMTMHAQRHGGIDLAVANAGTGSAGRAATATPASLDAMVHTNIGSTLALANAAVPHLRGTAGWFVAVASLSGIWPTPGFAGYSATKAAVVSLARSIAAEEAATGVRACAICPAFVDTDMAAWTRDRIATPLLAPADVAEAVRFLTHLSPAASVTELVLRRAGAGHDEP